MAVDVKKLGYLIGQLIQLLHDDPDFHTGYQEAILQLSAQYPLDPQTHIPLRIPQNDLAVLSAAGNDWQGLVKAIKFVRIDMSKNLGLKEAKDYVEEVLHRHNIYSPSDEVRAGTR